MLSLDNPLDFHSEIYVKALKLSLVILGTSYVFKYFLLAEILNNFEFHHHRNIFSSKITYIKFF